MAIKGTGARMSSKRRPRFIIAAFCTNCGAHHYFSDLKDRQICIPINARCRDCGNPYVKEIGKSRSPSFVMKAIINGNLKATNIGQGKRNQWRMTPGEVKAFMAAETTK